MDWTYANAILLYDSKIFNTSAPLLSNSASFMHIPQEKIVALRTISVSNFTYLNKNICNCGRETLPQLSGSVHLKSRTSKTSHQYTCL